MAILAATSSNSFGTRALLSTRPAETSRMEVRVGAAGVGGAAGGRGDAVGGGARRVAWGWGRRAWSRAPAATASRHAGEPCSAPGDGRRKLWGGRVRWR